MLIEAVGGMLAKQGLGLISRAIEGAGTKAMEWVEDRVGFPLTETTAGGSHAADLTPEQVATLKQLESSERIRLEELALARMQEANRHAEALHDDVLEDRIDARTMYTDGGKEMQDRLINKVFRATTVIIPLLILANVAVLVAVSIYHIDPAVSLGIGNVIGGSLVRFGDERKTILEFAFGGSMHHGEGRKP